MFKYSGDHLNYSYNNNLLFREFSIRTSKKQTEERTVNTKLFFVLNEKAPT